MSERLIRVLVYEGKPEWLQECLSRRGVKGSYRVDDGVIKEGIIGDFLEEVIQKPVPTLPGEVK